MIIVFVGKVRVGKNCFKDMQQGNGNQSWLKISSVQIEEYARKARQVVEAMRPAVRTAMHSHVNRCD